MKFLSPFVSVLACLSLVARAAVAVAPLDATFHFGGISYYPIAASTAWPLGVAQDSLGRLITVGTADSTDAFPFVARHIDGEIDLSFGVQADYDYPGSNNHVILDHEGAPLIAGSVTVPASCGTRTQTRYFTVRKLNKPMSADDGAPDASFGLGSPRLPGTALARVGGCNGPNGASAVAVDNDGYITAVGIAADDTLLRSVIGLARWSPDGKSDLNFNTDGTTTFNLSGTYDSSGAAIAVNSRGQLIVAGNASSSTGQIGIILRYDRNGALDTTFGEDGVSKVPLGPNGQFCCIAVDKYDRILVSGAANSPSDYPNKVLFLRFLDNGSADPSFGIDGVARPNVGNSFEAVYGMQLDARGQTVATGFADVDGLTTATTIHLNVDGSLNSAVGEHGIYKTYFGFGSSVGTSVIIDSLGRLIVSGYGKDRDGNVPVLIRYDELFGDGFD